MSNPAQLLSETVAIFERLHQFLQLARYSDTTEDSLLNRKGGLKSAENALDEEDFFSIAPPFFDRLQKFYLLDFLHNDLLIEG